MNQDIPLTRDMRRIAEEYPPYQRALIYEVLIRWKVVGSEKPFTEALLESAENPEAFADPRASLDLDFFYARRGSSSGTGQYKAPVDRYFAAVERCESDQILRYLRMNVSYSGKPSSGALARTARRILEVQSLASKRDLAEILAYALNRSDLGPVTHYEKGEEIWDNPGPIMSFWRRAVKEDAVRSGTISQLKP